MPLYIPTTKICDNLKFPCVCKKQKQIKVCMVCGFTCLCPSNIIFTIQL